MREESLSGETYLVALERGSARPYELGGDVEHELGKVVSRNALALLKVILACERGFGGNRGGVRLSHATSAKILRCSQRTAGAAMRELAELGLVEPRWHFTVLDIDTALRDAAHDKRTWLHKHRERTPCYSTTARARELCGKRERRTARSNQVGKKNHPGRNHPPLRGGVKGTRGRGRPESRFVSDVLRGRQGENQSPPAKVATVRMTLPDGRVALGSPLTPGVGRLADARVAKARVDDNSVEFFTTLCPRTWAGIAASERKADAS